MGRSRRNQGWLITSPTLSRSLGFATSRRLSRSRAVSDARARRGNCALTMRGNIMRSWSACRRGGARQRRARAHARRAAARTRVVHPGSPEKRRGAGVVAPLLYTPYRAERPPTMHRGNQHLLQSLRPGPCPAPCGQRETRALGRSVGMPVENGSSPASSQYSSAPSDHRSARFPSYVLYSSTCAPAALSGALAKFASCQSACEPPPLKLCGKYHAT